MTPFTAKRVLAPKQSILAGPQNLPRFVEGQLVTAPQLQAIAQAINARESSVGLPQTAFKAFRSGQAITAVDLNQFVQPLIRLSRRLGVILHLTNFPLQPGALMTAQTLNELVDAVNALR